MTTAANVPADRAAPRQFVCAEIWGGNRPIDTPIALPGLHGRLYSQPCQGGRGGDIHYISLCSAGLLSRLCLADVVGHGEDVARVSTEIHTLLRRFMNNYDERRVLRELNQRLVPSGLSAMTTAVAVSYSPPLRRVTISYAGHPPAWLYRRAERRWLRLRAGGREADQANSSALYDLPLAIDDTTAFSRRRLRVREGDRLLVLTDGVLEAPAPAGELYGNERLVRILQQTESAPPAAVLDALLTDLRAHTQRPDFTHDDLTALVVEFGPAPNAIMQILRNEILRPIRRLFTRART